MQPKINFHLPERMLPDAPVVNCCEGFSPPPPLSIVDRIIANLGRAGGDFGPLFVRTTEVAPHYGTKRLPPQRPVVQNWLRGGAMVAIWSFSSMGLSAAASVEDVSAESVTTRSVTTVQLFAEPHPETSTDSSRIERSRTRESRQSSTGRIASKCN